MPNFERSTNPDSRIDALRAEIESLRLNKIANTPDSKFAGEIQEEIEIREELLKELEETRH